MPHLLGDRGVLPELEAASGEGTVTAGGELTLDAFAGQLLLHAALAEALVFLAQARVHVATIQIGRDPAVIFTVRAAYRPAPPPIRKPPLTEESPI